MNNWQRLETKIAYQNPWMTVHEDSVVRPDGRAGIYGWVETAPAVFIVAVDEHKKIVLVQQTRYVTGRPSWELPAGSTAGTDPLEAAKREFQEEAGLKADKWVQLSGEVYPWQSLSPETNFVIIATGLHESHEENGELDDFITDTRRVSWHEVIKMIQNGEIHNGQSITALMQAGIHLGHIK
jgi:8-oxo-dGTP pyrophosphatase MutT (NUDIX family)